MDFLKYKIESSRNIKPNSLKAYLISIKKLNEYITNKEYKNLDFLKDEAKVLEKLDTLKLTTQKNYLSAVIVALSAFKDKYEDDLKTYRKRLDELNEKYNSEIKKILNDEKNISKLDLNSNHNFAKMTSRNGGLLVRMNYRDGNLI